MLLLIWWLACSLVIIIVVVLYLIGEIVCDEEMNNKYEGGCDFVNIWVGTLFAIQILCLFYFYIDVDQFEYFNSFNFKVNEKKNQISLLNQHAFCTIYGQTQICTLNSTQTHIWKYKIHRAGRQTAIGIDSAKRQWINDCFVGKKETTNYAYCSDGDIEGHDYTYTKFDSGYFSGDTVSFFGFGK